MELYEEILRRLVVPQDIALRLAENICYTSLVEIREIISNEALSDPECFCKIEEIICALERQGIFCGGRHDFG